MGKRIISFLLKGFTIILLILPCVGILFYINMKTWLPSLLLYVVEESHYSISGSKFDGNWVVDNKTGEILEKQGQSIFIEGNTIYSYGKSGYLCLNQNNDIIVVFYDDNTTVEARKDWEYRKSIYDNNLIIITEKRLLSPTQRDVYRKLKDCYMQYPYMP